MIENSVGAAPALRKAATAHPEVYIKSRASRFGNDVMFRIDISASASTAEEANQMIESTANDLSIAFENAGIRQTKDTRL